MNSFTFGALTLAAAGAAAAAASPLFAAFAIIAKTAIFPALVRLGLGSVAMALAVGSLEASPRWFQRALAWTPLRWLGLGSFSIYLWQQPFYLLHERGQGLWTLPAALLVAGASYYAIEAPARRWLNARYGAGPSLARAVLPEAAEPLG